MSNFMLADELDQAIDTLIAERDSTPLRVELELGELLGIAAELRVLPHPEFKAQLKADLMQRASASSVLEFPAHSHVPAWGLAVRDGKVRRADHDTQVPLQILPTLFGAGRGGYPIHQRSFAASLLAHVAVLALVVSAGVWAARHEEPKPHVISKLIEPGEYVLPPASGKSHGGGGGGHAEKLHASTGSPPRFSHEQLAPPAIIVRNPAPKLMAEPTVIGPPNITFPPNTHMGDPLSAALVPSNGAGTGGGIGSGNGTGVGPGSGPGVGPGIGGGVGDGPYRLGGGVSAPRPVYDPDPEYSDEARKAKYQGSVVLWVIIGSDGLPKDIRVARSLGMGLDERAMEAVRKWRFEPAKKDGRPVAVQVNIEVSFRLY